MITVIEVFIIILSTISFCFITFQMWYYIENYEYILKFNNAYNNLEYASSPSLDYIDKSYYDPNDTILNSSEKWRCVLDKNNGKYFSVSSFGFLSDNNTSNKSWNYKNDCILETFSIITPIVYNPCSTDSLSSDCLLHNKLMNENN